MIFFSVPWWSCCWWGWEDKRRWNHFLHIALIYLVEWNELALSLSSYIISAASQFTITIIISVMSLLFLAVTYARCRIIKIFNDRQITTTGANNDATKERHKKLISVHIFYSSPFLKHKRFECEVKILYIIFIKKRTIFIHLLDIKEMHKIAYCYEIITRSMLFDSWSFSFTWLMIEHHAYSLIAV